MIDDRFITRRAEALDLANRAEVYNVMSGLVIVAVRTVMEEDLFSHTLKGSQRRKTVDKITENDRHNPRGKERT